MKAKKTKAKRALKKKKSKIKKLSVEWLRTSIKHRAHTKECSDRFPGKV